MFRASAGSSSILALLAESPAMADDLFISVAHRDPVHALTIFAHAFSLTLRYVFFLGSKTEPRKSYTFATSLVALTSRLAAMNCRSNT